MLQMSLHKLHHCWVYKILSFESLFIITSYFLKLTNMMCLFAFQWVLLQCGESCQGFVSAEKGNFYLMSCEHDIEKEIELASHFDFPP